MSKKTIRIISTLLTVLMVLAILTNSAFALSPGEIKASTDTDTTAITNVGKDIVGVLQTVGMVLSVVILIVIGIKYMMGSASEKAEYKKTMMPYLVGAILIFAASAFADVIYDFAIGISEEA